MLEILCYPLNSNEILIKKKKIKKQLLQNQNVFLEKRIALISGSTIGDIKDVLELFLLNQGIKPVFYEGNYNKYYEDVMFNQSELVQFRPDIIYVHTSNKNIQHYPAIDDQSEDISEKIRIEMNKFHSIWKEIKQKFNCVIIQNNFEMLNYRILGNKDVYDINGKLNFINQLNEEFYKYARNNNDFYINDINYLAANYGLAKWSENSYWYMYKYSLCVDAIPYLCFNISNIIKSLYGKNQKCLALDLDNTLWGGTIGDMGYDGIELGMETPLGEAFVDFQQYLKQLSSIGITLTVVSKNDLNIAKSAFKSKKMLLQEEDFSAFYANWENKHLNLDNIAKDLNIVDESIVFVDDNPAERDIVKRNLPKVKVPNLQNPENYVQYIDKSGYFEITQLSSEDKQRHLYYALNQTREKEQSHFENYEEYLKSLEMKCKFIFFSAPYLERITQLVNKTNQFNLTTERYTFSEIEQMSLNENFITVCGDLKDKFGDNGIITIFVGEIIEKALHIRLWLMSCRVFKRNVEYALFDYIVELCQKKGVEKIIGYYSRTEKNKIVADFYSQLGFHLLKKKGDELSDWQYEVVSDYEPKNNIIECEGDII